jgi:2-desacetyl-2-hydroxyethyl bacteriochlorophyllide A dehydrogenase
MRALVYTGPGKVQIEEWPRVEARADQVEIKVEATGICGADVSGFLGRSRTRKPPMILGHEVVGRTSVGERVVVDPLTSCGHCVECARGATNLCSDLRLLGMGDTAGCFAEAVLVPRTHMYTVSEELDHRLAILAEPLANIVHLFRLAPFMPACRVGIVGAGTMGSLALQMALHYGAAEAVVLEVDEQRRVAAEKMGATMAVNPVRPSPAPQDSGGRGLDLVIDACGTDEARWSAFELCRPGGNVVLLGLAKERSDIDFAKSIRREHRAVMSFGYTREDFASSVDLLSSGAIDLREWTAEMPLEYGQQAFERMVCSRGNTLKMILRP